MPPGTTEVSADVGCDPGWLTGGTDYMVSSWLPAKAATKSSPLPLIQTSTCEIRAVSAVPADLQFARQYFRSPQPAHVYGTLAFGTILSDDHARPGIANVSLVIRGRAGTRSARSDSGGTFDFPDVAPGRYTLTILPNKYRWLAPRQEVYVAAHGCAAALFIAEAEGSLSGNVVDRSGKAATGVEVEYLEAGYRDIDPGYRPVSGSTKTDRTGSFSFSGVPPGDYYVGVHIATAPWTMQGIPPTYFPGVTGLAQAQIVHLQHKEARGGLRIQLGPKVGIRDVRLRVVWPNGRPAKGATVVAAVNGSHANGWEVDSNGWVIMDLLNDVEYHFSVWFGLQEARTEDKFLPADSSRKTILLVVR